MTLSQEVSQLLGAWLGSDASVRNERHPQLVADLIELIRKAPDERAATRSASMAALAMSSRVPGSKGNPRDYDRKAGEAA